MLESNDDTTEKEYVMCGFEVTDVEGQYIINYFYPKALYEALPLKQLLENFFYTKLDKDVDEGTYVEHQFSCQIPRWFSLHSARHFKAGEGRIEFLNSVGIYGVLNESDYE